MGDIFKTKKERKKKMKRIISFALFCATIISSVAMFASCSRKEQSEPATTYDYDVIADNENVTGKVSELPSEIVFMRSDTEGNAEYKATSTFIATVLPAYATNKACTWSLAWADSAETADLNDYVRISVSETDSREVTVNLVEYFGEKTINLTCTTVDSGKTATVPLTCFEAVKIIGIKDSEGNYVTETVEINPSIYSIPAGDGKYTVKSSAYVLDFNSTYSLDFNSDSRYPLSYFLAPLDIKEPKNDKYILYSGYFDYINVESVKSNMFNILSFDPLAERTVPTGSGNVNATYAQMFDSLGDNFCVFALKVDENMYYTFDTVFFVIRIPVESVTANTATENYIY